MSKVIAVPILQYSIYATIYPTGMVCKLMQLVFTLSVCIVKISAEGIYVLGTFYFLVQ